MAMYNVAKVAQEVFAAQEGEMIQTIPLGAVSEKEAKRELKVLKVLADDPIAKKLLAAKIFVKWGGMIECCDKTLVSVLLVTRFGAHTAYVVPAQMLYDTDDLAELSDQLEQLADWIHVADLVNVADRDKVIRQPKPPVEQTRENDSQEDDAARFSVPMVGTGGVDEVLWGNREVSAALIAAIDEQMHTIGKCSAPETKYIFEVSDKQTADWLRSLMEALSIQPGALSLNEEEEGTLALGPNDGEAEVVHVPLDGELPLLMQEEQGVLAEYVRRCLDDNVLAEAEQEWRNSVASENPFINSPAQEWRMLLVFCVPDIVFECGEKGKSVMGALNALEGILWPEYPAF